MTEQMSSAERTLHRYYAWSSKMRGHFTDERDRNGTGPDLWMYMSLWFALLYTAIEGWRQLRLSDNSVDDLLSNEKYVNLLRRYRNGVDHFQPTYWDDRFAEMISEEPTAIWATALTDALGAYFIRRAVETNHPALRGNQTKRP
jgi:hypothetical protein